MSTTSEIATPERPAVVRPAWWRRLPGNTLRKGTLALFDQGVVSATGLFTSIIVGRACDLDEVGLYSLGTTVLFFICCVQEALISSPFALYGNRLAQAERRVFAGSVLVQFLVLAILAMAGLLATTAILSTGVGPAGFTAIVGALAVVAPWMLLREFARRLSIAQLHLGTALAVDVGVSILQLAGLAALAWWGVLSPWLAFGMGGIACACVGLVWMVSQRQQFVLHSERIRPHWQQTWSFGRWVLASQLLTLIHGYILHWLVAVKLGTEATGGLALCASVVQLSNPFVLGMGNFLTPRAARSYSDGGIPALRRVIRQTGLLLAVAMLLFCLLSWFLGGLAVELLFRKADPAFGLIVALLACAQAATAIGLAPANGLGALERSDVNFRVGLAGFCITLITSWILTDLWGVRGASLGLVLGSWTALVLRFLAYRRLTGHVSNPEVHP